MTRFLLVALGGAAGSVARYGVGLLAARLCPGVAWPWGTFTVNVVGGLLMGILTGWLAFRAGPTVGDEKLRLLLGVGLLGGFTTFSAFSLEAVEMIQRRAWGLAVAYAGASAVLAVAALLLGLFIARRAFT